MLGRPAGTLGCSGATSAQQGLCPTAPTFLKVPAHLRAAAPLRSPWTPPRTLHVKVWGGAEQVLCHSRREREQAAGTWQDQVGMEEDGERLPRAECRHRGPAAPLDTPQAPSRGPLDASRRSAHGAKRFQALQWGVLCWAQNGDWGPAQSLPSAPLLWHTCKGTGALMTKPPVRTLAAKLLSGAQLPRASPSLRSCPLMPHRAPESRHPWASERLAWLQP